MSLYSSERARRSLFDTIAFRATSQLATVVAYIVLVRSMSKEDFGVFNLLYAFLPVFSMVASFGLEQVLRRFQPEYLRAGRPEAAVWLVRTVSRGRLVLNLVVLAAVLLCWTWVAPPFKLTAYRGVFAIFCFLTLLHFQLQILQMAMASRMLHRYSVGAVAALSWAKLLLYGALALQGSLTLVEAIVADTVAYAAVFLFLYLAYRREERQVTGSFVPEPAERRRLFRYGIFNSFNDAGVLLLYSTLDNFVIAAVIDVTSVGIYAFYTRLNLMAQNLLPQRLFDNVIQPLFFAMPAEEADQRLPRYFTFLLNMNLILQWPVLAYCAVYHADLVHVLFGGKFVEHSWLLPMIVAFATMNVIADPASIVAQYEEKAGVILASKIFAVYNIVAMLLMVPLMGIAGAVIASGTAQLMKNAFIWWHVRRRARWLNCGAALLTAALLWGGATALGLAIHWLPLHPIAQLAIGAVICGAALLIHLRSPALGDSDRAMLAGLLAGRESVWLRRLGILA